jgi:hypothetical protein
MASRQQYLQLFNQAPVLEPVELSVCGVIEIDVNEINLAQPPQAEFYQP